MPIEKFQRVLKRIDRNLSGPISLFPDQFIYGAREILNTYTNLDSRTIFKATFEHGWDLRTSRTMIKFSGGKYTHFSWCSERILRSEFHNSHMKPIGAPFVYLIHMLNEAITKSEQSGITNSKEIIFFPSHGNEFEFQNTELQINLFKKYYNPSNATVCLYWAEFVNPNVLKQYQKAGFKYIVTAGFSGQIEKTGLGYSARELALSPIGGRNLFYLNLISFLIKHQRIVVGGFGSVCLYAAHLDKEIILLNKSAEDKQLTLTEKHKRSIDTNRIEEQEFISKYMQVPFSEINYSSQKFREFANIELGVQNIMLPNFLKDTLVSCSTLGTNSSAGEETKKAILNYFEIFLAVD